ncbi:unnamed protein product [Notodromas monacha]|uniref:Protocadherin-like wing polarity protein stan n=1 Tax=Notodromas monacha TaxID=399045 RepID=A0A7R9GA73_9CRUS|nr:unnamed protein product [Notodromas monacha]CAG0915025.1 unnamed protein product [Notodromas monacha]
MKFFFSSPGPFFAVNPTTGAIVTSRPLDRETRTGFLLTVTASDSGTPSLSDATDVEILVADVNDNAPKFLQAAAYSAEVSESAEPGKSVVRVSAVDVDEELNGQVVYELRPLEGEDVSDGVDAFDIDPVSGVVRTAKTLDRESVATYRFYAVAVDRGSPPMSSSASVVVKILDENDSPPVFESERVELRIKENSRIGSAVGTVVARDPDIGENGRVQYSIVGGPDADLFSLDIETRGGLGSSDSTPSDDISAYDAPTKEPFTVAVLRTRIDLDYESKKKEYNVIIRASSPPLRNDVAVRILVEDVNDNAPKLADFRVMFNNYDDYFPTGPIGRVPASDADVTDILRYEFVSGNKAGLLVLNSTNGEITLSPALNTNVPIDAEMRVSVTDGLNTVEAGLLLTVRLVTPEMLYNSVTLRLEDVTADAFLDPVVYDNFVRGLAAIIPCPVDNVYLFNVQEDFDGDSRVLNISFTARKGQTNGEEDLFSQQFLQDKVYLNRNLLGKISGFQVMPFSDDLCAQEPCLNFQRCFVVLKFANAAGFISSESMLFRPIYPVSSHACRCPAGFTGMREHYECNTELNLCYSNPCGRSGTCLQTEGGYVCACPPGTTGKNCEINMDAGDECPAPRKSLLLHEKPEEPLCRGDSYCEVMPSPLRGGNGGRARHVTPAPSTGRGLICANCTHSPFYSRFCHLTARSFSLGSYLTFPGLDDRFRLNLKLKFATRNPNGLILFNGRYDGRGDFVALEVVDGSVRFTFSLGDPRRVGTVIVGAGSDSGSVDDGQWHSIEVSYYNKTAKLILDDCDSFLALKYASSPTSLASMFDTVTGDKFVLPSGPSRYRCANQTSYVLDDMCSSQTELCYRFLDLTGPMQLGGLPEELLEVNGGPGAPVQFYNFSGCISDLQIDHQLVDLNDFVYNNGTKSGCEPKMNYCSSNPCQRNAPCTEGWGTYICNCPPGWGGKDCSSEVAMPKQFLREDSVMILKPAGNLRPIQLPWHLGLTFRSRNAHGTLMSVAIGGRKKAVLQLRGGRLEFRYDDGRVELTGGGVADGSWHQAEVTWMAGGKIWVSLDYGAREATGGPIRGDISGLLVESVALGGPAIGVENNEVTPRGVDFGLTGFKYFVGCVKDVRVGGDSMSLDDPLIPSMSVIDGCGATDSCVENACPEHSTCVDRWNAHSCPCGRGYVGPNCFNICDLNPCANGGVCVLDPKEKEGYSCQCSSPLHSGRYCEQVWIQPCPTHWWGYPVCGPCSCPVEKGYDAECDKDTGACQCEKNHYRPNGSDVCLPCECYSTGSFGGACEAGSGQCRCRDGVIGRRCDSCANPRAEVTTEGCDVIYTGCPKSFAAGLWWDRTVFGKSAVATCPRGSQGLASRFCDVKIGWIPADTFNCTSDPFVDLARQLSLIERGGLQLSSYTAVRAAADLRKATNSTRPLHGSDVLISAQLLGALLHFEMVRNLNLTHRKDKDYIKNLVESMDVIVGPEYEEHWSRVRDLTGSGLEVLIALVSEYGRALAISLADVYTRPFEIVTNNMVFGLDVLDVDELVDAVSVRGSPPPPRYVAELTETGGEFLLPKYDNFVRVSSSRGQSHDEETDSWFRNSHFKLKLDWGASEGNRLSKRRARRRQAVVFSYAFFHPSIGAIMPAAYSRTIKRRWGLGLQVGSPLAMYHVHYPDGGGGNDASLDDGSRRRGTDLRLQIDREAAGRFASGTPQCVWWQADAPSGAGDVLSRVERDGDAGAVVENGGDDGNEELSSSSVSDYRGKWSKDGCRTTVFASWEYSGDDLFVDCSCSHAHGPMAVLVDRVEPEYVLQVGFSEEMSVWFGVGGAVLLLFLAAVGLFMVVISDGRSGSSVSNAAAIHAHVAMCCFFAIFTYLLALKLRVPLLRNEFGCKFVAMSLHYLWMSVFAWMVVDALHVYRMLTELRDVNHGGMRVYLALGYGAPAVVTALAVGVRADQFGTVYFCWLSMYESVIWSLVGPICTMIVATLVILVLAFRASLDLKGRVDGFANLRLLLWLCVGQVPLVSVTWALSLLAVDAASANLSAMHHALSASAFVTATYLFSAYCVVNRRTRRVIGSKLSVVFPCCCSKLARGEEDDDEFSTNVVRPAGVTPARAGRRSGRTVTNAARVGYGPDSEFRLPRRGFGFSTSSTTSRSTCKTSSSPYRSDIQLRNPSTSSVTESHVCKSAYDCDSSCCETAGRDKMRKGWSKSVRTSESDDETWDEDGGGNRSRGQAGDETQTDDCSSVGPRHRRNQHHHQLHHAASHSVGLASSHSSDEDSTVVNGTVPSSGRGKLVVKEYNSVGVYGGNLDARLGVKDYGAPDLGIPCVPRKQPVHQQQQMHGDEDEDNVDGGVGGLRVVDGDSRRYDEDDDPMGGYSVPKMRPVYSTHWTSQLPPSYVTYQGPGDPYIGPSATMGGSIGVPVAPGGPGWYPSPTDRLSTSDNEFAAGSAQQSPPGRQVAFRPGSLMLNLSHAVDDDGGVAGGGGYSPSPASPPVPAVPPPMSSLGTTATTGTLTRGYNLRNAAVTGGYLSGDSVNDLSGDDSAYPRMAGHPRAPFVQGFPQRPEESQIESDDNETPV